MFRNATRSRGLISLFGTKRERPLAFTKERRPTPPNTRQSIRKVQGGISARTIFITGQLKPQKKLTAARRRNPTGGRPPPPIFPAAEDLLAGADFPG